MFCKPPFLEMIKPSKEELALQTELHRLQNARTLDEAEFENQKQVLQTQLQSEVSPVPPDYLEDCGKLCDLHSSLWSHRKKNAFVPLVQIQNFARRWIVIFFLSLSLQVERCAQLKAQLTECEERAEWMTKHVEEIKTQLHQTQQGSMWCNL